MVKLIALMPSRFSNKKTESIARVEKLSYFQLLHVTLKNKLFDKPGSIYNVDETNSQLNNKIGEKKPLRVFIQQQYLPCSSKKNY